MGVHTGVYVVFYLYRSRYSFVADHCLKDGHHIVDFSNLEKALKFQNEAQARRFIADDLERSESGPYFVSELSLGELLEYCPELYEVRRAELNGGAARAQKSSCNTVFRRQKQRISCLLSGPLMIWWTAASSLRAVRWRTGTGISVWDVWWMARHIICMT